MSSVADTSRGELLEKTQQVQKTHSKIESSILELRTIFEGSFKAFKFGILKYVLEKFKN